MKRNEKLLFSMGEIDEEYINEANPQKKTGRIFLKSVSAIAACACLLCGIGVYLHYNSNAELPTPDGNLPLIEIGGSSSLAMGFEGYLAHDVSELVNANPWNEKMNITALPVFENTYYDKESGNPKKPDFEAMEQRLREVAERMGVDSRNAVIQNNYPTEDVIKDITEKFQSIGQSVPPGFFTPSCVYIVADGIEITVDSDLETRIDFKPSVSLPEKYNFSHYASFEEASSVAEYLKKEYKDLIKMEKPKTNVFGGDYTYSGEQGYQIEFFEGGGSAADSIINYNFNRVSFACDDSDSLFIARVTAPDLSEKIGNYPIITAEEARKLLKDGRYITTADKFPGGEYIRKTELVYRTDKYEKVYLPYYRILAELPQMKSGDLNCYGAYYVPAVKEEYISDMPLWDGRFN